MNKYTRKELEMVATLLEIDYNANDNKNILYNKVVNTYMSKNGNSEMIKTLMDEAKFCQKKVNEKDRRIEKLENDLQAYQNKVEKSEEIIELFNIAKRQTKDLIEKYRIESERWEGQKQELLTANQELQNDNKKLHGCVKNFNMFIDDILKYI